MHGSDIECRDELGEIAGVGGDAEVFSFVRPRPSSIISLGQSDVSILVGHLLSLGDLLSNRFQPAKILQPPRDEDDRFAGALLHVLQTNAVDLDLLGRQVSYYWGRSEKAQQQR